MVADAEAALAEPATATKRTAGRRRLRQNPTAITPQAKKGQAAT